MADGALPSSYTTPPNVGTAGSTGGATLTQGAAMPNITTTQQQATGAPSWYTDYLQNIASKGSAAADSAQFVGPTAMQNQSYDLAQSNVGNWQPQLDAAKSAVNSSVGVNPLAVAQPWLNAGTNPTYNTVDKYMSPYLNDVVSKIGDLAQTNFTKNVAPATTAGFVGSGQFGSQRGAQALGQTMADYNQQTTGKQLGALDAGYNSAMGYAGADATRNLQAGQTAGTLETQRQSNLINAGQVGGVLAGDTQQFGLNDVNTLNTLGTQQQQIEQARQLFPLQMAQTQASLLQGAQIPTSSSSSYTGPIPGAYQTSPLSQIAGIGSLLYGAGNVASGASGTLSALQKLLSGASSGASNPLSSFGGTPGTMDTSGAVNNNPFPTYSPGDFAGDSNTATDMFIQ